MLPPPEGLWGLPPELLEQLPGYGPDVAGNRAEARRIMQQLGYAPDKPLAIKRAYRSLATVVKMEVRFEPTFCIMATAATEIKIAISAFLWLLHRLRSCIALPIYETLRRPSANDLPICTV
jgi:hypothetical protein